MSDDSNGSGKQPMSPAKRRRLQQCFEQGSKVASAGQFDYATDMYSMCVTGDPGNPIYVKSFLANLQKKYNNNKKGAPLAGMKCAGSKAAIKKSALQKDWTAVVTSGLEVLKINPWDTYALVEIGKACESLEHDESQLEFLRMALQADPAEPEINRVAARAMGRQGQFDEAINCWTRVTKAKPGDEEAMRAIGNLSVEKTIDKGGYETAQTTKDVKANKFQASSEDKQLSPVQKLERAISKDPANADNYIELAELYMRDENYAKAEEVLTRALQASGGDVAIRERLEDVQLRRAQQQLNIAAKKAKEEKTEEAINLYNEMKLDVNNKEVQIYATRCERHPANLGFKYELAVRLEKIKKYQEAIKLYQEARNDLKRKGHVFLGLGRCFTQIKQYKLALTNFESAVEAIPERDLDLRKEALYLAGKLAVHVKDIDAAEKHLGALAGLDFAYKDVAQWLDKLEELREDGGHSSDD